MEISRGERLEPGPSSSVPPSSQRSTPSITPSTTPSSRHPPASAVVSTPSAPAQPATLAKRLLFPHLAADSSIPPLLRSSNIPPALDAELYDFIALTLRAFVNPWWTKLTRYDKDFLPHITHITTHVVRVFEERLQSADLSSLVFREIPLILNQHFLDYRVAAAKKGSAYAAGGQYGIASIFHSQQQHIGVTADGRLDEIYVRTALDSVLKICLPREDWAPETERHIVREVILMVICKNIAPKLTQGWFIQKMVLDLMGQEESIVSSPPDPSTPPPEPLQFNAPSVHTLLVFFLSTVQTVSSIGLAIVNAYKHALHIVKLVNDSPYGKIPSDSSTRQPVSPTLEQTPLQGSRIFRAVNLSQTSSSTSSAGSAYATSQPASVQPPWYSPGYAFPPLVLATSALSLSSRFLPSALLLLLSMGISFFSHFLDRLFPYALYTYVLAPQQLIGIVANAKRSLFPNGYPAQAPPDPTLEEQLVIRSKLISRIDSKLSPAVASALLGPPAVRLQTISDLIDPLSNAACNTHLFILILDAITLTLFPELGVGGTEHE